MTKASRQFDSTRRRRRAVKRLERRLWKKFKVAPSTMLDFPPWDLGRGASDQELPPPHVEWLGYDDDVTISTAGIRAYWVAPGGYIDASLLTNEKIEMGRDTIGFHLVEDADKVRKKGLKWFSDRVLERAPRSLGHEIDLRVKALLVERYGKEEAKRGLWEGVPGQFAFFGKIRLKEYMEVDANYWHLEGRLDFGGVIR